MMDRARTAIWPMMTFFASYSTTVGDDLRPCCILCVLRDMMRIDKTLSDVV